ncbi:ABC transporter ATP-binding protein [Parafannyhessea umbonata]|uniref:Fatty acid ABC transporter ATP-binding/permease protein n=1 Tax=Parafannyhessea umbonata TaxID=604330 RepID=A0A1H9QN34_9ACTN|nr:ABC transporter ATP-binding protein [Parafannyhessea umbonata]SER61259.1 ATP-binding cassette, subfamily B [Parafannyhessea umbonata]
MPNPYTGGGSASAAMATVRGGSGKGPRGSASPELEASSYSVGQVLLRMLSFVRPHIVSLSISFVAATVSVVLQLYVPILTGRAIDCLVAPGSVGFAALTLTLQRLALTVALAAALQWAAGYCTNRLSYETVRDLRTCAFSKFERLPLSFVDSHAHGDLLSRVVNDVDQLGDGLLQGFNQLFNGIVAIVVTLAFMLSISLPVAALVIVLTPLSVGAAALIARLSAKSFARQQAIQGELGGFAEETITNQKLVSAFARSTSECERFSQINQRLYARGERAQFVSSLTNPSTRLVNNVIYAAVALLGFTCVISSWPSALTVGQVQSFLSYANQYMKPFNEISSVVTQVQTAFASARRVLALLDAEDEKDVLRAPETPPADAASACPERFEGRIDFESVSFSYAPDHPLITGLSLHIPAGKRFALVGPTGCGKTTLINLLLRFYELDAGRILLDGRDTATMTKETLRSAFGMVLQESWLFEGTVAQNISYGRPGATRQQIEQAARRAHAHKFIMQLPQGYDTVVGEDGGSLSQGQRQLLCIARVMLTDPAVLLLDEATSSIDTRTELQVQDAFDRMMEGRTSLVVAHRLSTIKGADCILAMRDGRLIESGTHEELLSRGGFYAKLYRSQFAS